MAWQKNKVLLVSVQEVKQDDGTIKKVYHRYVVRKSKGAAGKQPTKLKLKKFNPTVGHHTEYTQVKYS